MTTGFIKHLLSQFVGYSPQEDQLKLFDHALCLTFQLEDETSVIRMMALLSDINHRGEDKEAGSRMVVAELTGKQEKFPGIEVTENLSADQRKQVEDSYKLVRSLDLDLGYIGIIRTLETILEEKFNRPQTVNLDSLIAAFFLMVGLKPDDANQIVAMFKYLKT